MRSDFIQYTTDYISGVMTLRKPQTESLKILDKIFNAVNPQKDMNISSALDIVHKIYPTCTDFEREFMSITFALATGVGKTRLMGAFIAYLYTQQNIRNFFIVAPSTTIYEKLKSDLSDWNSDKYVFRGLGCFPVPPQIIKDDDYQNQSISLLESNVHIFIFNIDKFNKENANMKRVNEMIGDSFYNYLSNLPDLVLIMDESHHYRAKRGTQALNELNPILGLELTATPMVTSGTKQIKFKNVVFEYPLSAAISDGYTRTPFAVTRSDINFYNFGDEELDKMMLNDGIKCHELAKRKLSMYARDNSTPEKPIPVVKPFMLVVCKDTEHANKVKYYVCSDDFCDGAYKNKTIMVHSKLKGAESDEYTQLLLDVESSDNLTEIVIHVNMLKEGWDVNNLYTIVPLRTAASRVLREQMVGRGLRLPYGVRTGDKYVDSVMLTAHDKFAEILEEAQSGDSIFKSGNIIKVNEIEEEQIEITSILIDNGSDDKIIEDAYRQSELSVSEQNSTLIKKINEVIKSEVTDKISSDPTNVGSSVYVNKIVESVTQKVSEDPDLGETFRENYGPLFDWMKEHTEETCRVAQKKYIPIPQIKITDMGEDTYCFKDFDLDTTEFNQVPIKNDILIQNLINMGDRQFLKGDEINFDALNPEKVILEELKKKPEVDYEKCSELLSKLIKQAVDHYKNKHTERGMQNIVMMYKKDISNRIYKQMMQHFVSDSSTLIEEIVGVRNYNLVHEYSQKEKVDLFRTYTKNINSVVFDGIKKGVFSTAKFDSDPELVLARILETDDDVKNWLRPAKKEFDITYNHGHYYEPDFVVETDSIIYLVEIKGENRLNDPDVIEKKKCAERYCELASRWCKANGYKEWKYLFIPSGYVTSNSRFAQLAASFQQV